MEFDANARGPWEFKPAQRSLDVHPGQMVSVMYEFRNTQNRTMVAQAIPSYAPTQAAPYFNKLECFCFTEHTLAPGESRQWPVVFVIDPKLPQGREDDHPVLYLLRGRRQGACRRPRARRPASSGRRARGLHDHAAEGRGGAQGLVRQTMKAVAWSFFGVRKSAEYEKDVSQLNPVHVVIAGVIGAALFVRLWCCW